MRLNKDRFALLAGIDGKDQYVGKTLRENYSYNIVSEADEAGEEAPVKVKDAEKTGESASAEDTVSKEEVATALAGVLGVDADDLTALVTGKEESSEEESSEEESSEEDKDLELESDYAMSEIDESWIRETVRKELKAAIRESHSRAIDSQVRRSRQTKSVAVAMGFKK